MAEGQTSTPSSVSYLTTPTNVPTMHHGSPLNLILIAATATIVTLLCLFLAGVTFYVLRKRHLKQKKQQAQNKTKGEEDAITKQSQFQLSHSNLGSEQDIGSSRHSRTTCDSCSTRLRYSRPTYPRNSTIQRPSRPLHSSFVIADDDTIEPIVERTASVKHLSVRLDQQLNRGNVASPTLEEVLTDYKAAAVFDWDRCAFEDQEEKSMWLSSRPHSFAVSQTLQKNQLVVHNRACSESATLSPSPTRSVFPNKDVPSITKTITWNDSPLTMQAVESPTSDYFGNHMTRESSLSALSPGLSYKHSPLSSPSFGSSSDLTLPLPVSPMLVHSPQRQSYCVRAETQDWESHAEAVERMEEQKHSQQSRKTYPASKNSLQSLSTLPHFPPSVGPRASHRTVSKVAVDENGNTTCLSPLQMISPSESKPFCTSPLSISTSSRAASSSNLEVDSTHWPPTIEILQSNQCQGISSYKWTQCELGSEAAAEQPMQSPMQLHRFSRRGALSPSDWPTRPVNDYDLDSITGPTKQHNREQTNS